MYLFSWTLWSTYFHVLVLVTVKSMITTELRYRVRDSGGQLDLP